MIGEKQNLINIKNVSEKLYFKKLFEYTPLFDGILPFF